MPLLKIFQDSKGKGTCRSCGAPIEWAELTSGKRHPFDYPIRPSLVQPDAFGGRVVELVDTGVSSSHFATCPQGRAWSKDKGGAPRRRPQ